MLNRRHLLSLIPAIHLRAAVPKMKLCIHQTTSAAAGYRKSLEGYAKAGIQYVEPIGAHLNAFIQTDGLPAAKRSEGYLASTDGPIEHVRLRCVLGHCFLGPSDIVLGPR